jgi:hypothetical protein
LRLTLGRRDTEGQTRERHEQTSLALPVVLEWLGRQEHPRVLDLGGAHGDNVAFLSRFGCRLEIVDLFAQLTETGDMLGPPSGGARSRAGTHDLERIVAQTLERSDSTAGGSNGANGPSGSAHVVDPLDLVLAWDLFDYLTPAQIGSVHRGLSRHLQAGARLFTQISYVGNLPLRPRRMRISSDSSLVWDAEAPRVRPSPRYTERQILKLLPGMKVEKSFLLRNGYREIIAMNASGSAVEVPRSNV